MFSIDLYASREREIKLSSLVNDESFTDVTLVSRDGGKVFAHKIILMAASQYFDDLLHGTAHQEAVICMPEVNYEELLSLKKIFYLGYLEDNKTRGLRRWPTRETIV